LGIQWLKLLHFNESHQVVLTDALWFSSQICSMQISDGFRDLFFLKESSPAGR
jgi:hypothetical protein